MAGTTMHNEKTLKVKKDSGNSIIVREIRMDGVCNGDETSRDRKVGIKVLKKHISSDLESVTIRLVTES